MSTVDDRSSSLSLSFVEGLYADYLREPESVSPDWRHYFDELSHASGNGAEHAAAFRPTFEPKPLPAILKRSPQENGEAEAKAIVEPAPPHPIEPPVVSEVEPSFASPDAVAEAQAEALEVALLQDRVDQLVRAYRVRGHLVAAVDPLGLPRPELPELDARSYGFTDADMDRQFSTDTIEGTQVMTLRRILERLRNTYCRSIGVQFMHMDDLTVRQ
ncbi:MAG: hypothetical protein WBW33_31550, partial [Bryobacteraceae bacterium]